MPIAPARVTMVNAPGGGIADDKAVYSYMPEIIEFYTRSRSRSCRTCRPTTAASHDERAYVLETSVGAGGQGSARLRRLRHAGRTDLRRGAEIEAVPSEAARATPHNYIVQPTLALSHLPDARRGGRRAAPSRSAPLRAVRRRGPPAAGGSTRGAEGQARSVVNSSQGGGTKDTWLLED